MADRPSQRALSDFVAEAQEIVEALDAGLVRLDDTRRGDEARPDALNAVFRAAHSLKGLAALFGVERMAALAHALEDRLDDVRMGRRPLDAATLDLLLAAPAVFARIVAEEAAQAPAGSWATGEAAAQLASRLREAAGPAAAGPREPVEAVEAVDLAPSVRAILTEYEEHRLRSSAQIGARLYRVRAEFDLASFDAGLDALERRLEPLGEVIATLPSAELDDPGAIAFDLLFASREPDAAVGAAAAPATAAPIGHGGASAGLAPAAPRAPGGALAPDGPAGSAPVARASAADLSLRSASRAVRVDIGKLDALMNLVGELVLAKTSLLQVADGLRRGQDPAAFGLELHRQGRRLERKLEELQGGILEVRMVPLGQTFDKLSRMVRKLGRDLGKEVELEVRGSEVGLDKLIVEELSDPLLHLVRNALDHALEPPEERARAGKPRAGRVRLAAQQRGSHVVVSVEDDGRGIDEERLRAAAVERGLLTAEAAAQLSRRETLDLVFVPGLSTAREVTSLSGRGVGMDVVKSNVAALSGLVELHSVPGQGTRVDVTLPVTLAIVRALVVTAGGRTYAVPVSGVLEIVSAGASELRAVERREVLDLRGATVPLVRLARYFGHEAAPPPDRLFVVVVGLAHQRLGLAVDALAGQQDVVVKPLGRALAAVRGIAGATDLGSRQTVLVVDVAALLGDLARRDAAAEPAT